MAWRPQGGHFQNLKFFPYIKSSQGREFANNQLALNSMGRFQYYRCHLLLPQHCRPNTAQDIDIYIQE